MNENNAEVPGRSTWPGTSSRIAANNDVNDADDTPRRRRAATVIGDRPCAVCGSYERYADPDRCAPCKRAAQRAYAAANRECERLRAQAWRDAGNRPVRRTEGSRS